MIRQYPACAVSLIATVSCLSSGCERTPVVPTRLVLITLDTLRYDAFDGGGGPAAMPRLAERARAATPLRRFYASTSSTQPSHATMFTGLHPWEHGVTRNGMRLDDRFDTVAEALAAEGFETRAVVGSFPVAARFGFGQGFESYDEGFTTPFNDRDRWNRQLIPGGAFFSLAHTVTDKAIEAIDESTVVRQFFWFHYFDPHAPYGSNLGGTLSSKGVLDRVEAGENAEAVLTEVKQLYRTDAEYLDRALDRLLARLDADAGRFETHVLLVADHGESLGEGGSVGHGHGLSREEIHVPAVIISPRVAAGPRDDLAGSIDVGPTLLALAGLEPWEAGGRDLTVPGAVEPEVCGMRRTYRDSPTFEHRLDGNDHVLPDLLFYVVDAEGRIVRGTSAGLADAAGGRDEPILALFGAFEAGLAECAMAGTLDPEVERALRSLGYMP